MLKSFNSEEKNSLPIALYAARSFIVHKFRKLPETDFTKIDKINQEFEKMIIGIILNYKNAD